MLIPHLILNKKKNTHTQKTLKMILVNQDNFTTNSISVTEISSKWPMESALMGKGIAIDSEGSLFKPY